MGAMPESRQIRPAGAVPVRSAPLVPYLSGPPILSRSDSGTCAHIATTHMFAWLESNNEIDGVYRGVEREIDAIRRQKIGRRRYRLVTPKRFVYPLLRDAGFRRHMPAAAAIAQAVSRWQTFWAHVGWLQCEHPTRRICRLQRAADRRVFKYGWEWACGCLRGGCTWMAHYTVVLDGVVVDDHAELFLSNPTLEWWTWWTPPDQRQPALTGFFTGADSGRGLFQQTLFGGEEQTQPGPAPRPRAAGDKSGRPHESEGRHAAR